MCDHLVNGTVFSSDLGPLQMDYVHFYDCIMADMSILAVIILMAWTVFLIYLLGNTATNYFSSTLASICGKLNLSYDIAGVTFLAFGNGAPDVFSSIASLSGGSNALIGVGSILGGSVFVTTIVVGLVAIICPCAIPGLSFTRDIVFYLIVASLLAVITLQGKVTLFLSFSLFGVYIAYALAVVFTSYYQNTKEKRIRDEAAKSEILVPQVQTAYWYKSQDVTQKSSVLGNKQPKVATSTEPGAYTFLILNESSTSRSGDLDTDEDTTVINLSGGLISPEFSALIIEDYFDIVRGKYGLSNTYLGNVSAKHQPLSQSKILTFDMGSDTSAFEVDCEDGLTTALIPQHNQSSQSEDEAETILLNDFVSDDSGTGRRGGGRTSLLYWQQLLLRRRLNRSVMSAEWWQYSWPQKLVSVVESPFTVARDFTIPTIDEGMWYKPYAVIQPVAAFIFMLIVTGQQDDSILGLPAWILFFALGLGLSLFVFFTTNYSYPPKSFLFSTFWVLFSFAMCIGWIYTLAGELVACLTALGYIFSIPPIFLGLTVLAWGNSIGDLFSNVAVARRNLGPMALAGCYGGPVFDILVGLGFALTIAASTTYPDPYIIQFDVSSLVSLVFLFTSLLSTLIVVTFRGYVLERWFGYALVGLYCIHTFVQAIFLIIRA